MKSEIMWSALVGLATVLGGVAPAIAQPFPPSPRLAQAEDRPAFNFETNPDLCTGQIVNGGNVCITDDPNNQSSGRRAAMMLYWKQITTSSVTLTVVRVTELAPNEANLLYAAVVDEKTLPNQDDVDRVDRPLLMAGIRPDGTIGINANYGQYPPNVDRMEEANRLLGQHQAAIQQLINTLNQTR